MLNKDIIKELKKDIQELKQKGLKYSFGKLFLYNKYSIHLNAFCPDINNAFNKSYREIQFKTISGANKFILLLNKEFKYNLKGFKI